jgi:hypothetical protein
MAAPTSMNAWLDAGAAALSSVMLFAQRLAWMALIWATSVSLLGVVSLLLRWWIK